MEAENKMYGEMRADGQEQPASDAPSTVAASPYYAPPSGAGYGGGSSIPLVQQQQQVTIVTVNQSPVVLVESVKHVETFVFGAILYSCFVLWFCSVVFGLIGFILASEYTL